MKYIKDYKDGDRISDIYLCKSKHSALTRNGKAYDNVSLLDKTGTIDAKVWEPNSAGIEDYDTLDYIEVVGDVTTFNGALQVNIKRIRKCAEGEYDPADYMPSTPFSVDEMWTELTELIASVEEPHLQELLNHFFGDEAFAKVFRNSSAAKSIHHSFVGGLLQHTLGVARICDFLASKYYRINRDLLITAAICHDIGKVREISAYPQNDYTDAGQYLGHIVIGVEMIGEAIRSIDGFPVALEQELKHCILSHHGEYEFGSPKKPAIIEAVALNYADNTDAKLEAFTEILENSNESGWMGFNRIFDSNIHRTEV
ncbi:MAG: HD domain-containing protein [Lachnospiraceae bacterium]|nr:HD domain-containing protein [Lachnospiraceae bacterium]